MRENTASGDRRAPLTPAPNSSNPYKLLEVSLPGRN